MKKNNIPDETAARDEQAGLFAPLASQAQPAPQTRQLLDKIPALIDKTFPLPGRFRSVLPADVAELSRLLTSGRGERSLSYLGRPNLLSAYLRYFLPWNLYRLCRLLPALDINISADDRITDLGCGPLTFAAALWICRPDMRSVPLTIRCIDRSGPVLDAGRKLFTALAGENSPWKIHTTKGDVNTAKTAPSALVCAVNVFNEMYGDISRSGADHLQHSAEKAARSLEAHASASSAILVVEPGFPRCGEFISLLRGVFLRRGRRPASPCPHDKTCPFQKKRWCHFTFETEDAPAPLRRLSAAAGIPKERAALSYLYAGPANAEYNAGSQLRVISDAFPLPPARPPAGPLNRFGRYCCAQQGLVLLTGHKNAIEKIPSGALVNAVISGDKRDPKSGALLAEVN